MTGKSEFLERLVKQGLGSAALELSGLAVSAALSPSVFSNWSKTLLSRGQRPCGGVEPVTDRRGVGVRRTPQTCESYSRATSHSSKQR